MDELGQRREKERVCSLDEELDLERTVGGQEREKRKVSVKRGHFENKHIKVEP